jgi:serine protease AprX
MIYKEAGWIRYNALKLCPQVKKAALEWYRPVKYLPCFLYKPFKFLKQRLYKIPVIVQATETRREIKLSESWLFQQIAGLTGNFR